MNQDTFNFCHTQSPIPYHECQRYLEWYNGAKEYGVTSWDKTQAAWALLLIEVAKHVTL